MAEVKAGDQCASRLGVSRELRQAGTMASAPYGLRLLVGAATVAVEETMKLPRTILMYPMTLASQAAHMVMRFQQNLADLVIKGDSTLESIFPPKDEQAEWATFDEDLIEGEGQHAALPDAAEGDRRAEGRFALYSVTDAPADPPTQPIAKPSKKSSRAAVPV